MSFSQRRTAVAVTVAALLFLLATLAASHARHSWSAPTHLAGWTWDVEPTA
jgi:hypothetical protein